MNFFSKTWALLLCTVFVSSVGQISLKIGVQKIGGVRLTTSLFAEVLRIFSSPWLVMGFLFYALSAYLTLVALSKVELSVFSLFTCLSYVIVLFASYFFFNEIFTFTKIAGCVLTILGVYLITIG